MGLAPLCHCRFWPCTLICALLEDGASNLCLGGRTVHHSSICARNFSAFVHQTLCFVHVISLILKSCFSFKNKAISTFWLVLMDLVCLKQQFHKLILHLLTVSTAFSYVSSPSSTGRLDSKMWKIQSVLMSVWAVDKPVVAQRNWWG